LIRGVRDNQIITLEEAHWRMAALPARCAGFTDRGTLTPGAAADIIVYDLDKLAIGPSRVSESATFRPAPGDECREPTAIATSSSTAR